MREAIDTLTLTPLIGDVYETTTAADVGLSLIYAFTDSSVWPSVQAEQVSVRGPYETGIRIEQAWNASLTDCFVNGVLGDEQEYANPQQMQVGIDLVGAMDAHLTNPRVTSAHVGIRARTHPDGYPRSEGLHITDGWIMHTTTAIELNGSSLGGWPTPWVKITGQHLNFGQFGVRADQQSGLHLSHVNFYASHYRTNQWGIYLTGCMNVVIDGCEFWANRPGFYGAIVLDNCTNVHISGGILDDHVLIALNATASCKNVTTSGPQWEKAKAQGKVVNRASA